MKMKKMKLFMTALLAAATVLVIPQTIVHADEIQLSLAEETEHVDSVGNVYLAGDSNDLDATEIKKDLFMVGSDCKVSQSQVSQDALIAGNTLTIKDSSIDGSLRAAGYSITVSNTNVHNNITAAANAITVDSDSSSDAAIFCANVITFDGECGDLKAYASSVTVSGTITGDALICADKVKIADSAVIKGNLRVESANEPDVDNNSSIGNLDFVETVNEAEAVAVVTTGAKIAHKLLSRVYWVPALALVAFIFCLIFGKALTGAVEMVKSKPAVMLGSGAIALLALPLALILICITYIGLPLAGLLALLLLPIFFFAVTFTGASLGRLVFKTFHPWLASILGAAILVFLKIIPVIGFLIGLASIIYTLGYMIQICFSQIKSSNVKKHPIAAAVTASEETKATVSDDAQ